MRRAVALTLDRKAFIDIMAEGKADIGGAMLPPPAGVWGLPPEELKTLPGYGADVKKNRAEARKLMEKAGYGPNKRLQLKVSTRNLADLSRPGRDPDRPAQGHLYRRRARSDRDAASGSPRSRARITQIGLNLTGNGIDDPDQTFYENYRLRLGAQLHQLLQPGAREAVRRSNRMEPDLEKRKKIVWEIDKKLPEDVARPILYHSQPGHLLGALREERHHHVEQLLQRAPLRGRVAG